MTAKKKSIIPRRGRATIKHKAKNNPNLSDSSRNIVAVLRDTNWAAKIKENLMSDEQTIYIEKGVSQMNPIVERILLAILRRVITEEMVKHALSQLVVGLGELAKKSDNEIDDAMVAIIAKALGVDAPSA